MIDKAEVGCQGQGAARKHRANKHWTRCLWHTKIPRTRHHLLHPARTWDESRAQCIDREGHRSRDTHSVRGCRSYPAPSCPHHSCGCRSVSRAGPCSASLSTDPIAVDLLNLSRAGCLLGCHWSHPDASHRGSEHQHIERGHREKLGNNELCG